VPVAGGRRGNPVLFDRRHFAEIGGLTGDTGARGVLLAHPDAVVELPVDDSAVLIDIDRPEDINLVAGILNT